MLWATDAIGLAAAIAAGAIYDCGTVVDEAARDELIVRYELGLSRAVLRAGYGVRDAMGADYRDWPAAEAARCVDPWKSGRSRDYAPEQLVFWKVSRQYVRGADISPTNRGGAAAATGIFLRRIAAPPRPRRRYFSDESRRRRGRGADISPANRGAAAAATCIFLR